MQIGQDCNEIFKFLKLLKFCWDIRVFISFDHSIALLGLILTGFRKMSPVLKVWCRSVEILLRYLQAFISFDHLTIALLGLISTGSQKSKPLFWRFGADRSKLATMGHFEPLWCEMIWKSWKTQNCPSRAHPSHLVNGKIGHCGSFWAASCEVIWKSLKTPKNCQCTSPRTKKFWDFSKNETLWWQKDGESCESGEIGHSESIWAWF